MLSSRIRWLLVCVYVLVLAGCGRAGPERASVSGTVTLEGHTISEGSITFVPTDGSQGPTAGGAIRDGKFEITKFDGPIVGKNRVELRSWKLTGRQIPNPMSPGATMDEKVEAFPDPFNNESRLVREIASGHNTLEFNLKPDGTGE
jgi:hypothetical protein